MAPTNICTLVRMVPTFMRSVTSSLRKKSISLLRKYGLRSSGSRILAGHKRTSLRPSRRCSMNKRNRVAEIAVRKLRRFGGREWCGYLTPAEVVYLLDKGCKLTETNKYKEELARTWFGSG